MWLKKKKFIFSVGMPFSCPFVTRTFREKQYRTLDLFVMEFIMSGGQPFSLRCPEGWSYVVIIFVAQVTAVAQIQPLVWELPCATGVTI